VPGKKLVCCGENNPVFHLKNMNGMVFAKNRIFTEIFHMNYTVSLSIKLKFVNTAVHVTCPKVSQMVKLNIAYQVKESTNDAGLNISAILLFQNDHTGVGRFHKPARHHGIFPDTKSPGLL